ncbi:MAG: LysR family transcriptional regulator [Solirubrobacterales bacterium]
MLDVRRLKVLREVAERGSFSAAADALNFTQSAISQQIAALERETGTTLLQRGAGGVRLTDAGRALVTHTEVILAQLADAERELAAIAGLRGGRVRLASFPSAGATLVTEAVSRFKEQHPEVELSLTEGEPDVTVPALRRGEFDLAVAFDYKHDRESNDLREGLECIHLLDDPVRVVLPADHPLARRKAIRLEQLANEPWVGGCLDGVCHGMVVSWCGKAGFEPKIVFESDDHNVQMGLVAAGVGVTLLPDLALRIVPANVETRSVAGSEPWRKIFAAVPSDAYRSPATEAMIEVLQAVSERFELSASAAAA